MKEPLFQDVPRETGGSGSLADDNDLNMERDATDVNFGGEVLNSQAGLLHSFRGVAVHWAGDAISQPGDTLLVSPNDRDEAPEGASEPYPRICISVAWQTNSRMRITAHGV